MTRQDPTPSEYVDSSSNLLGRLQALYELCIYTINEHPPSVAVSYITSAIDRLSPHVERHEKARKALLEKGRELIASREEADNG